MIHSSSHPRYRAHEPVYQGRNKQTEIHYNNFVYNRLISKNKYRWLVRNPEEEEEKNRRTLSGG